MVERFRGTEEVSGSRPLRSTIKLSLISKIYNGNIYFNRKAPNVSQKISRFDKGCVVYSELNNNGGFWRVVLFLDSGTGN